MTAAGIPSDRTPPDRSGIRFLAFAAVVVAANAILVDNYARVAAVRRQRTIE